MQKRFAVANCGGPGGAVAQVELFEDSDDIKVKAKWTILLADAKIDALSQPFTPNDSSTQGSFVSVTSPEVVACRLPTPTNLNFILRRGLNSTNSNVRVRKTGLRG